jgi:hypothetical protein
MLLLPLIMLQRLFNKIGSIQRVLIIVLVSLFFSGCVQIKQKNIFTEMQKDFTIIYDDNQYAAISSEEASLLGFIGLPYSQKERWYKKNDNLFIGDLYYQSELQDFNFELLKQLYIDSGWVFVEQVISSTYVTLLFKKISKDLVIFIESVSHKNREKNRNSKVKKKHPSVGHTEKNNQEIILHQAMVVGSE